MFGKRRHSYFERYAHTDTSLTEFLLEVEEEEDGDVRIRDVVGLGTDLEGEDFESHWRGGDVLGEIPSSSLGKSPNGESQNETSSTSSGTSSSSDPEADSIDDTRPAKRRRKSAKTTTTTTSTSASSPFSRNSTGPSPRNIGVGLDGGLSLCLNSQFSAACPFRLPGDTKEKKRKRECQSVPECVRDAELDEFFLRSVCRRRKNGWTGNENCLASADVDGGDDVDMGGVERPEVTPAPNRPVVVVPTLTLTRTPQPPFVDVARICTMFESFLSPPSESISCAGVLRLCRRIGIYDPFSFRYFLLMSKLKCETRFCITRTQFGHGLFEMRVDTFPGLQRYLEDLELRYAENRVPWDNPETRRKLQTFAFRFMLDSSLSRCVDIGIATQCIRGLLEPIARRVVGAIGRLVLVGPFCRFVQKRYKVMTLDQFRLSFEFLLMGGYSMSPELFRKKMDEEVQDGAWPTMFDEFYLWYREDHLMDVDAADLHELDRESDEVVMTGETENGELEVLFQASGSGSRDRPPSLDEDQMDTSDF